MKKAIVLILSVILLTAQAGICQNHSLIATLAEESYCFDPDFIYDCF